MSASQRDAPELPIVGSAEGQATNCLVSFGDYVLKVTAEVWEGGEYSSDHFLESIDPMLQLSNWLVIKNVRVQGLVEGVYVAFVEDLFGNPAGGRLFLFFKHTRSPAS